FGIGEIPLASPSAAIGLRLRQMQRSGPAPCAFSLLAERFPVPFQCSPNWFPILRRRFHDYFFGLLLNKPCRQRAQLFGVAAKLTPLKLMLTVDFNVRHNHCQHLLMNIDSRWVERRGPCAENKVVTDTSFIRFRGPQALTGQFCRTSFSSWPGAESVLRLL